MGKNAFVLSRRFLPLFATQFSGAANDNLLKNALLIFLAYNLGYAKDPEVGGLLSNLAAGLFILPYFLCSSIAGQLADKYDRACYTRMVKLLEILLMIIAAAGFALASVPVLMIVLCLMGAQSTLFSPAKYGLLPVHLRESELLTGNAWIGGGTYLAILCGSIAGGVIIGLPGGRWWCGGALIAVAVIGYWASRWIPAAPPVAEGLHLDWNVFRQSYRILRRDLWPQKTVLRCVFSASVFWMIGSLYLTQLPIFTRNSLGGGSLVCTGFFALFSVGVGVGSWLIARLSRGVTAVRWYTIAGMGLMALAGMDLAYLAWATPLMPEEIPWMELSRQWRFWRICGDVFLIAIGGGSWAVPLQAVMQHSAHAETLARVIAGNNIVNSFAMTLGAVICGILMKSGFGCDVIFCGISGVILLTACYTLPLLRAR